jgi:hypothetical protein
MNLEDSFFELVNYYNINNLVTINDDKIDLLYKIELPINNKPISVLSVLGAPKSGKSTLANCIATFLLNNQTNFNLFNTNTEVNLNYGIEYVLIETKDRNILILDVIEKTDRDLLNTSKILLFIYLVSDVILYNEKNADNLNQNTKNYFSILKKINLSKINLNKKDEDSLSTLIFNIYGNENDMEMYEEISYNLNNLFLKIDVNNIEITDENNIDLLNNNKYKEFLTVEIKYKTVCENIVKNLYENNRCENISSFYKLLENIKLEINNNIDWNNLPFDSISQEDINKWKEENITKSKNINIISDDFLNGTEDQYVNYFKPLKKNIDEILQNYKDYFFYTKSELVDKEYQNIKKNFLKTYNDIFLKFKNIAISHIYNQIRAKLESINNYKFEDNDVDEVITYINYIKKDILADNNINLYYNEYVLSLQSFLEDIAIKNLLTNIVEIRNKYNKQYILINDKMNKFYNDYANKVWDDLEKCAKNIFSSFETIKDNMINFIKFQLDSYKLIIHSYNLKLEEVRGKDNYPFVISVLNNNIKEVSLVNENYIIIKNYTHKIEQFSNKFNEYRNSNLQNYIYDIPKIINNIDKTKLTFEKLIALNYDVYYLDIYPSKYYIYKTNNFVKEKYDFVSQKINILQIYTKAVFESKYPAKVVQYYYYMLNFVNNPNNSDNKIHIGIIKNKIIDMLYDYIIINNK